MRLVLECLVAMAATLGFSVLFQAPKRQYVLCAVTGALGWLAFSFAVLAGCAAPLASFIATLVLMLASRAFSALRRVPTIVFLLAGIFPLVPGAGIYYTAYYAFAGDGAMAAAKLLETIKIAGAIVLGILFGYAIPQGVFNSLVPATGRKGGA